MDIKEGGPNRTESLYGEMAPILEDSSRHLTSKAFHLNCQHVILHGCCGENAWLAAVSTYLGCEEQDQLIDAVAALCKGRSLMRQFLYQFLVVCKY